MFEIKMKNKKICIFVYWIYLSQSGNTIAREVFNMADHYVDN